MASSFQDLRTAWLLASSPFGHPKGPKVVVVDPPRQGLTQEAREALRQLQAERMVYVSCDCATQARDLKDFVKEGYVVERARKPSGQAN